MKIRHSLGSYEVVATTLSGALEQLPEDSRVITDANVAELLKGCQPKAPTLILEPGEGSKSLHAFGECLSWLAQSGASRKTSVVAIGGGVVGDLTGFVASTYMRGVPFVQIPTTLLAQVDSSVGGKVGVDLPEGKNMAGAFYPPSAVYVPFDALSSLPDRQFRSGMAEAVKYGLIMDNDLTESISTARNLRDPLVLRDIVMRCIALKAQVVEADEHETNGIRATLNFGHTVGHAIEKITGYGPILHGEAISIGMVVEARLGERLGISEPGTADLVTSQLSHQGLPISDPSLNRTEELMAAMRTDKKAQDGKLAFSLLTSVGKCKLVRDVPDAEVRATLLNL